MNILFDLLKEFNLTEKETSIYHYLLNFGDQPASLIAKQLNLQRSSCYGHLQKLIDLGVILQIIKNNICYYSAAPVETVLAQIKQKQRSFDQKIRQAENELSSLKVSSHGFHNKAKAHYFSGKNGLLQILENILIEKPRQLRAYISRNFNSFIDQEAADFPERRADQGIQALAIHPFGKTEGTWQSNTEKQRSTKTIPPVFDLGMDVLIYNNKTTLVSSKEEFGITIESDSISQSQSRLFDFIWKFAHAA